MYWKEQCFGLTAETLVDKAVALKVYHVFIHRYLQGNMLLTFLRILLTIVQFYGGHVGGNNMPTDFLCLLVKVCVIHDY